MFGVLLFLFIAVPLVELYLLLWVGSEIGLWQTIGIIVLTGVVGASLARQQGLATLARVQTSMAQGQIPHREMLDGLMILVAGAVLLTPGLLTDAFGFALLLPPFRRVFGAWIGKKLKSRVRVVSPGGFEPPRPPQDKGDVIDIEYRVKDEERES